jgi:uncharacterized membrane protein
MTCGRLWALWAVPPAAALGARIVRSASTRTLELVILVVLVIPLIHRTGPIYPNLS